MAQIPDKRVETVTFVPAVGGGSKIAVKIPGSEHYSLFVVHNVDVTDGLNLHGSFNGTTHALLNKDAFSLAAPPHIPSDEIAQISIAAPLRGGVWLVTHANLADAGNKTATISMYGRNFPGAVY